MSPRSAAALEDAQSISDSISQVEDAIKVINRDDVYTPEIRAQVGNLGLGSGSVESSPDANQYVSLYHAYDGRMISVPAYMVTSRNNSLLINRFPSDNTIPAKYRNKQVWHLQPQAGIKVEKPFLCRLSVDAPAEMRAEMLAAGLSPVCRKPGGWATQYEADEHFRIKHRQRWAAWQRYLTEKRETRQADTLKDVIETLAARLNASPQSV